MSIILGSRAVRTHAAKMPESKGRDSPQNRLPKAPRNAANWATSEWVLSPLGFESKQLELVFALIGMLGTDLEWVERVLCDCLNQTGYTDVKRIHLSHFLSRFELEDDTGKKIILQKTPEDRRIETHMAAGNALRRVMNRGDALALLGVEDIYVTRSKGKTPQACPQCKQTVQHPVRRWAYILNSLKRPEEVHTLRRIYGVGFFLVGVFQDEEERRERLAELIAKSYKSADSKPYSEKAKQLIEKDYFERDKFGQRLRDTFHLADVFVPVTKRDVAKRELKRFIELIFGHPHIIPTPVEQMMFLAHAAAARSGSLSRQVGAVVASNRGDVISVGCNEVPRAGGGQYLPSDPNDARDVKLEKDSSDAQKEKMVAELLEVLRNSFKLRSVTTMDVMSLLKDTRLMQLIEFGRCEHAETEAITAANRNGVPVAGKNLYTTTFPCHDCAKVIIAAGIERVIYIEPYSKSLALELHHDAMSTKEQKGRVKVEPFTGVGPRRFIDFFSLAMSTGTQKIRKTGGRPIKWNPKGASPGLPMLPHSYLDREVLAIEMIKKAKNQPLKNRTKGGGQ